MFLVGSLTAASLSSESLYLDNVYTIETIDVVTSINLFEW